MLNELCELYRGMREAGFEIGVAHRDVKAVGAGERLWIRLKADGKVGSVASMSKGKASRSWTIRNGQQNPFPALAMPNGPLVMLRSNDPRANKLVQSGVTEGEKQRACLELLADDLNEGIASGWLSANYLEKLAERAQALQVLEGGRSDVVLELHRRFLLAATDPRTLLAQIKESIRKSIATSDELASLVVRLTLEGKAPLYFDIQLDERFDKYAFSDEHTPAICRALLESSGGSRKGICALTGQPASLVEHNFPQPNLPMLGQTYVYARNDATRATFRYGRSGAEAYTAGEMEVGYISAALEVLTGESREGKTWSSVASELPKQSDLLISYVASASDSTADWHVAKQLTFSGDELNDDEGASAYTPATFVETCRALVEATKGVESSTSEEPRLSVLIIRKIDTANRKIIFREDVSVTRLLEAAEEWSHVFQRVPPIRLPVQDSNSKSWQNLGPPQIKPAALVYLTKKEFVEGGTRSQDIIGGKFGDAARLLWASGQHRRRIAQHWLRQLVERTGQLLLGVGGAQFRNSGAIFRFDTRIALRAVSALHIVLAKMGRVPVEHFGEHYMSDTGYNLGRLLAAADVLHRGYCADKRKDSLPTRLMGNALMPMAQTNPARALAVLGQRWPVYQGWATKLKRYSVDEKYVSRDPKASKADREEADRQWAIVNALKVARAAEILQEKLHGDIFANPPDDAFRAELLLGYLAGVRDVDSE